MMNGTPGVSVITPFYNPPLQFMIEAIESVFAQTYSDWELILIDDSSSGESTDTARWYAEKYPEQVHYFEHPNHLNHGASASRNLGIRHARGKYLALLDADDIWLPDKLEQQVAILGAHPEAAMLYGNTLYWYSWTGKPEDRRRDFMPKLGVSGDSLIAPPKLLPLFLLGQAAVPCTCSVLVRRQIVDDIGGFAGAFKTLYDDQVLYAKICLAAPVFVANACWDRYRQHPESSCSVAAQTGQANSTRLRFLRWLSEYLSAKGVVDTEVWQALNRELWRYDEASRLAMHTVVRTLRRRSRKLWWRITEWGWPR
jgi:glycosyltransferase involved in cell wall biosynthesis